MIILSFILLILTACGGIFLISFLWAKKNTPKGVVMAHGSLGAITLISLIVGAFYYPLLWLVVIIFAIVACGGFYTVFTDVIKGKLPLTLAQIHGLLAVIGLISLTL